MNSLSRSNRRGLSSLEVIVVAGIASSMLTIAVVGLHTILRAKRRTTQAIQHTQSVTKLGELFRQDVRAANEITLDGNSCQIQSSDSESTSYEIVTSFVTRVHKSKRGTHRDRFQSITGSVFAIERDDNIMRLILKRGNASPVKISKQDPITGRQRTIVFEAIVGRDLRFLQDSNESGEQE